MTQAQARLKGLQKVALSVGRTFLTIGKWLSGFAGIFASFAVGGILKKIFGDAAEQAQQAEERTRTMTAYLMQNAAIRKKGLQWTKAQVAEVQAMNEALAEQQGISGDMLDTASTTLARYGAFPKKMQEMGKPLYDFLVVSKGVRATEEDMSDLTSKVGKAIVYGQVKGLQKANVHLGISQKIWKSMKPEARYKALLKYMQGFAQSADEAWNTPMGRIEKFRIKMQQVSQRIGRIILPMQADLADAFGDILKAAEPLLLLITEKLAAGLHETANIIRQYIVPAFQDLTAFIRGDYSNALEQSRQKMAAAGKPTEMITWWQQQVSSIKSDLQVLNQIGVFFSEIWNQAKANVIDFWNTLQATAIGDFLKQAGQNLKAYFSDPLGFVNEQYAKLVQGFDQLVGILAGVGSAMLNAFVTPLNTAIGYLNNFISTLNKLPLVNLPTIPTVPTGARAAPAAAPAGANIPTKEAMMPAYQHGGIIRRATMGLMGERGPEAVIPLRGGGARAASLLGYANRAMGMGGTNLSFAPVITINGNATDSEQRAMDSRLRDLAADFIDQFKRAQWQERRLSYESGYA